MKLYIDDARIEKIQQLWSIYPADGVTTNPTILKRAGRNPVTAIKEIRRYIGDEKDFMTQVVSVDPEGMYAEAQAITRLVGRDNTYVKIPANVNGLAAIKLIKSREPGIHLCATAIYSVGQGLIAAQAGADLVAPYVSRIDNLGQDGIKVAKDIQDILDANGIQCGISSASFKTTKQVIELAKRGVRAAAISVEVWESFLNNAVVDAAVDKFNSDFEDLAGVGKTFANCTP